MLNLYTPQNTSDKLMGETSYKRDIENKIMSTFLKSGFFEVQTPIFEYFDLFSSENVSISETDIFKFVDSDGKILALRPDMTTPISRVVATKLKDESLPIRLSYCGSVFRSVKNKQKEFTQSGMELVGVNSPMADAEIIMNTIEALKAVGLSEFQIEIGQSEFFKGILKSLNLAEDSKKTLEELIDHKDSLGLSGFLKGLDLKDEIKEMLQTLPSLFGDVEIIRNIDMSALNDTSKKAVENLKDVCDILSLYGYDPYISIDLAMVQSINYYTGVIFKGFARGVGFSIASGGRYDDLIEKLGADLPATGSAINVDMLMTALYRQSGTVADPKVDVLVFVDSEARSQETMNIIKAVRQNGLSAEMYLESSNYDGAVSYAGSKEIGGILRISDGCKLILHNIAENSKCETTLDELLGEE